MSAKVHKALADFLKREDMSQADFADLVGVSAGQVSHWITLRNVITGEKARDIERATKGKLTRRALRPDIFSESVASES